MPTPSLLQRLKERKLVQWALAYLAGAWVLYEVTATVGGHWGLSDLFFQGLFVVLAIGFFITLVLAWYHGEKGRQKVSGLELLMVAALLVVAGVTLSILPAGGPTGETKEVASSPQENGHRPTVAVLPPEALGLGGDEIAFADGMADAIWRRLSLVPELRLKARYSSDQLDISRKSFQEIGNTLNSEYLLTLRIYRDTDAEPTPRVQVSAQLVHAPDAESVWGDSYDEPLESEFHLQARIAEQVVQQLDIHVAAPVRDALRENPTTSPLAWEYFQEGNRINRAGAGDSVNLWAAEHYRRAIETDSTFAMAYRSLAGVLFAAGGEEHVRQGEAVLNLLIQLDPEFPEIQLARGGLAYAQGDYDRAAELWGAFLLTRPSDADVLHNLGLAERRLGRWDSAVDRLEKTVDLSPLFPAGWGNLGMTQFLMRRYTEAEESLLRQAALAGEAEPIQRRIAVQRAELLMAAHGDVEGAERVLRDALGQADADDLLGAWVWQEHFRMFFGLPGWGFREDLRRTTPEILGVDPGFFDLARAVSEEADGNSDLAQQLYESARIGIEAFVREDPQNWGGHGALGVTYAALGLKEDAVREGDEAVRLMPVTRDARLGPNALMDRARILARVGEHDRAISDLDTLLTLPSRWSVESLKLHPNWDPLRNHPRFQALLEEFGDDVEH